MHPPGGRTDTPFESAPRALSEEHHVQRPIGAGPDLRWHIARAIDPRRSNCEQDLHDLAGQSLLLPGAILEAAFRNSPKSLQVLLAPEPEQR